MNNFAQAVTSDANVLREGGYGQAQRFDELLGEEYPRRSWRAMLWQPDFAGHKIDLLVVIHDPNVYRLTVHPPEANAIPIIDPNRILSTPITMKLFQVIARRSAQIFHRFGEREDRQLVLRLFVKVLRELLPRTLRIEPVVYVLGPRIGELHPVQG